MIVFAVFLSAIIGTQVVAQSAPPQAPPPEAPAPAVAPVAADVFNTGQCLDSPGAVPKVLQAPVIRSMQIVRIDRLVSTSTMLPDELLGFVYTVHDGTTWLGKRTESYTSSAAATELNRVLASTHLPNQAISAFPAQSRVGPKAQQYFRVQIPQAALAALRIRLEPCVVWPDGRQLPDPTL
jgi:hypothetical protein